MPHERRQTKGIAKFSSGLNVAILPKPAKFNSHKI